MTISIKPTASGSTIEQDGGTILSVDGSGNLTVANNLSVTGTAPIPDALSTASGSAPSYSARAWIKFNGTTATINGSGNISSLTDGGTGKYIVNLTTAMPDALYTVALGVADDSTSGNMVTNGNSNHTPNFTTSSFRVQTMNFSATQQDKDHIHAVVFR